MKTLNDIANFTPENYFKNRVNYKADLQAYFDDNNTTAGKVAIELVKTATDQQTWFDNSFILSTLQSMAIESGEFSALKNKSVALNKVCKQANAAIPLLQDELLKDYKLKDDGSLYSKDKERFDSLLNSICKKLNIKHLWLRQRNNYWYVDFEAYYQCKQVDRTGYCSTVTFKREFQIFQHDENKIIDCNYKAVTYKQLLKAEKNIKDIKQKIIDLISELSNNKVILSGEY